MNETTRDISGVILLAFLPDQWGEAERFAYFCQTTFSFDRQVQKRLPGIFSHFRKAHLLLDLAKRLEPSIQEDEREVNDCGFSRASRSRELSALVETMFCELYTVLDCFRHVMCGVYPNHRGIKASTRATFQKGHKGELDDRIPQPIRDAFQQTKVWFDELRRLRDEFTHADVGSCHRDKATGHLDYMHSGLGKDDTVLIVRNVFAEIERFATEINNFLGQVFQVLNATLRDEQTEQMCGILGGRFYSRIVTPSEAVDRHAGICKSLEWFDTPGNPKCPLSGDCMAYARGQETQTEAEQDIAEST